MASVRMAVAGVSAALAAAAAVAPLVVDYEGWERRTYRDPVGVPTVCAGVTGGQVVGEVRTDAECVSLTATALARHAAGIAPCVPASLPTGMRGAFVSLAYNIGTARFCASTVARKAMAGDLAGACAELSRWTYAGGRQMPGLVRRRAAERALCEQGLRS